MASPLKKVRDLIELKQSEANNPMKKRDVLEKSLQSGVISKEEYNKEKENVEEQIKDFEKKAEELKRETMQSEEPKKSDRTLTIGIIFIIVLFAGIFAYVYFSKENPKTIEDLHVMNLRGELDPELGYVYGGAYSFVFSDGFWHLQLVSPKRTKHYDIAFRFSPRDVENISIQGLLDKKFFDNSSEIYVTFNPLGTELKYVGLAHADFDTNMINVFEKLPVAACDRNETQPCKSRPIVTCDDEDKLVLYVKESESFKTYYDQNCLVVEGKGLDLVKGIDRMLYELYGIMNQS